MGAPVLATDVETTQLLTYSLSGSDAGSFSITSDTAANDAGRGGQISVKSGVKLDHETKPSYMVRVTATDPDNLSASIDVTIMVTDMNEAPEVTGDGEIDYAENGTRSLETFRAVDPEGRMIYWSLLRTIPQPAPIVDGTALQDTDIEDADDFSISAGGVLSFNIPPDHEGADDEGTDNEYKIVVVASDGAPGAGTGIVPDPTQMGYKKVVVEVTDVGEGGMVTLPSLQPQVGVELMATLTDPEVPSPVSLSWKWEKSRSRSSWTAIDGAGETATHSPGSTSENYYLRVTASYEDDEGTDRTAQAVSAMMIRTEPTTTDEGAAFPAEADANNRTINENSPAGANVGDPVAATDTQDDVLTYSLSGTNVESFDIDPATGQITVGPRTVLDHEAAPNYTVMVTAREASGAMEAMAEVTITVRDVNEAPMVTEGVTMLELPEYDADTIDTNAETEDTRAKTVDTYVATDPEAGMPTWKLQGPDMDKLMIGTDGALTFREAPNYEMPADAGRDNVYNVTVVGHRRWHGGRRGDDRHAGRGHHGHQRGRGRYGNPVGAAAEDRGRADGRRHRH